MSWNEFYAGKFHKKRTDEKNRVHWVVRSVLDPDKPPFETPVAITVTAYFKGPMQDCSNICSKLYEDALKGWLIADDSPKYVASMTAVSRKDNDNPRVEILIREVA